MMLIGVRTRKWVSQLLSNSTEALSLLQMIKTKEGFFNCVIISTEVVCNTYINVVEVKQKHTSRTSEKS